MNNNGMILQQGYRPILIAAIVSIVLLIIDAEVLGTISIIVTLFLLFSYRNSSRHIFTNTTHVLSPVDGKLEAIDHLEDEIKLYCKVGMCDIHNVKAPLNAELKVIRSQKGLNLDPKSYKGSILNEQLELDLISADFEPIKLNLIGGFCNGSFDVCEKESVEQGENISVITDGMVVITLKGGVSELKIGDKLTAGQSVILTK